MSYVSLGRDSSSLRDDGTFAKDNNFDKRPRMDKPLSWDEIKRRLKEDNKESTADDYYSSKLDFDWFARLSEPGWNYCLSIYWHKSMTQPRYAMKADAVRAMTRQSQEQPK